MVASSAIPSLASLRDVSGAFAGHARSCKKGLDCSQCQKILSWYGALPLPLLARVLEDRSAPRRS